MLFLLIFVLRGGSVIKGLALCKNSVCSRFLTIKCGCVGFLFFLSLGLIEFLGCVSVNAAGPESRMMNKDLDLMQDP